MKNVIFLLAVSVLATALGCECPTQARHQHGGMMSPEFRRDPNARWDPLAQQGPASSMGKVMYLGVQVVPVPEPLRAQLSLPQGVGLMVMDVAPHSPAAQAKLARFDVLVKLNDQYLINREQLAVLLGNAKVGQEVRLTVIRQAKPTVVGVKIASHPAFEGPMGQGMPDHAMRGAPMGLGWATTAGTCPNVECKAARIRARKAVRVGAKA